MPWFRMSNYNRGNDDDSVDYSIQRFGLSYWPHPQIAFKADYGTHKKASDDDVATQINVGVWI